MAILLTGGAGYIGSHMAHHLIDLGVSEVVVLDDLSSGFEWSLPGGIPFIRASVGDFTAVDAAINRFGIDTIVHFAASTVVPESIANPFKYYRNNTENSLVLLQAAAANGVRRFIFSSTAAVYGSSSDRPIPEEAPTLPESPYGWSKLMTEQMLQDIASQASIDFVILRYFNACGADALMRTGQSTKNATHLIKVAAEAALELRPGLDIYGVDYPTPDGTCVRDYVHVSDLVAAHIHALDYLARGGKSEIFNCGYGHGHSVKDVIEVVKRVSGSNFQVSIKPRRTGDPAVSVANSKKIRTVLNWEPRFDDLDTIVQHALAWQARLATQGNNAATIL
jgi:UDP-glucose 4-epimerase